MKIEVVLSDADLKRFSSEVANQLLVELKPHFDRVEENTRQKPSSHEQSTLTFLRIKDLTTRIGLSRSTIYKMVEEGGFPVQVKLGERSSAWRIKDIEKWELSRS